MHGELQGSIWGTTSEGETEPAILSPWGRGDGGRVDPFPDHGHSVVRQLAQFQETLP